MTASQFSESHFDAKADRYHAAIRAVPTARYLEILPFFLLLNSHFRTAPSQLVIADLLCGGGYLSEAFRGCFRHLYGIDVSSRMLRMFPRSPTVSAIKAAVEEQTEILGKLRPDIIVSLAGLHHIYHIQEGKVDPTFSTELQCQLILTWAKCLSPDGLMIIADVTDPGLPAAFTESDLSCKISDKSMADRAEFLYRSLRQNLVLPETAMPFPSPTLSQHSTRLCDFTHSTAKASPGNWFRRIVAERGLYGHMDNFVNPNGLISFLTRNGFSAEYFEMPTPWLFPSKKDFVYYFYEKFAFGPPVQAYPDISSEMEVMIVDKADQFLGIYEFPSGGVSVGWRLGYYRILRQTRITPK